MAHAVPQRPNSSDTAVSRRVQTEGVFRKCDACGESVPVMALRRNLDVCPESGCGHHFQIGALRRVEITVDPDSFRELFGSIEPVDPLEFRARRSYAERLREAQRQTGLKEAVVCGEARIHGQDVVLAVMDCHFISGSMGSVVGEKITRAIEHATAMRRPIVIVCCSGGARMDEGALSLMQMAKTSAALYRHDQAGLACITVLTHPTLAGVSASFAFLGDVIIAEPKAMIGFTGAIVIEQTIKKKLPEGFQEAEFLLEHGQIDMVVERKNMRETLAKLLAFATHKPARRASATAEPIRMEGPEDAAAAQTEDGAIRPQGRAGGPAGRKRTAKQRKE
ncbi:MAG: acetyl-CoA carboxylase, carboxyltransferase subunit beta [Planctomycetota bacterium]|nr:acetyl-CoA carboxylase, carboxyltransferase subunit beta [Planctomycetota bacterium]